MKVGKGDDSFYRKKEDGKSERESKTKCTDIKSLLKPNYPKLTTLFDSIYYEAAVETFSEYSIECIKSILTWQSTVVCSSPSPLPS